MARARLLPQEFATVFTFARDFSRYAGARGVRAAGLVFAGAIFEGLGLALMAPLLGIVIGSQGASGRFQHLTASLFRALGTDTAFERLALLLGVFAVLMILRTVIITRRDVALASLQIGFVEDTRLRIAERLASTSWARLTKLRHARITHLVSGDIQRVGTAVHFLLQVATALVMLSIQCALAFWLAPLLACIAVALLIASIIAMVPVLRLAGALGQFVTHANLELLDSTAQFLGGLKLAIAQDLQLEFVKQFRKTLTAISERQIATVTQQSRRRAVMTALTAVVAGTLVLVGYGAFHLSAPLLISFLLVVARMHGPANQLQQGAQQLAHALPAYESTKQLARDLVPEDLVPRSPAATLDFGGDVELADVQYRHTPEGGGVSHIHLRIRPGEMLGIAGASGAGKTTLADLLIGLLMPQQGIVRVGAVPIRGEAVSGWRRRIAYVPQDPFVFHDTIRHNLLWGDSLAEDAALWRALAVAGAAGLVNRLGGLDAMVGERGIQISGGERQRIALARAMLRHPVLFVLDEATNALDVESESEILTRLRQALPSTTFVMIAHREQSLAQCDRIVRMTNGTLVADLPKAGPATDI